MFTSPCFKWFMFHGLFGGVDTFVGDADFTFYKPLSGGLWLVHWIITPAFEDLPPSLRIVVDFPSQTWAGAPIEQNWDSKNRARLVEVSLK